MDECFICMEEPVKVFCSSCHKTIGEKCFRKIKSCPFCRASFNHNPRQKNDRLPLIARKNFIQRINQKLEELREEIENASQLFRIILTDLHTLDAVVNLSRKIEQREKHLYQIRIEALIKQVRRKEKEEEDEKRKIEKQIKEKGGG